MRSPPLAVVRKQVIPNGVASRRGTVSWGQRATGDKQATRLSAEDNGFPAACQKLWERIKSKRRKRTGPNTDGGKSQHVETGAKSVVRKKGLSMGVRVELNLLLVILSRPLPESFQSW
jgi:hypothetical protein